MTKTTYKKIMGLITYTILLALCLFKFRDITGAIGSVFKLLTPLWTGLVLAFVLNVPMSAFEKKVFGATNKKIRTASLLISILLISLLFVAIFSWVIPDLIDSLTSILKQVPTMVNDFYHGLNNLFKNTELSKYLTNIDGTKNISKFISSGFSSIINNFTGIISNSAVVLFNLFTGTIIAIYFLFGKEKMLANLRKVELKIFDDSIVVKLDKLAALVNKAFHDFIAYQCLECLVLGLLMFIAFKIFNFPYALTIAFLTAITAVIPIFGATIALIVGAILIATESIKQAIIFIIVFEIVQQLENNVIYPHVVGKHVGLPPILTILAIIVGGKVGGFVGMIICVTLTSVINTLFWYFMKKDIPKISLPGPKKAATVKEKK